MRLVDAGVFHLRGYGISAGAGESSSVLTFPKNPETILVCSTTGGTLAVDQELIEASSAHTAGGCRDADLVGAFGSGNSRTGDAFGEDIGGGEAS